MCAERMELIIQIWVEGMANMHAYTQSETHTHTHTRTRARARVHVCLSPSYAMVVCWFETSPAVILRLDVFKQRLIMTLLHRLPTHDSLGVRLPRVL